MQAPHGRPADRDTPSPCFWTVVVLLIAGLSPLPATGQAQKPPDQTTPPKETPQPPQTTPQPKTPAGGTTAPADTPVEQPTLPKWQSLPHGQALPTPQQCPASGTDEKITALVDKLPALEERYRVQQAAWQNDEKNYEALRVKLGADDPKTIAAHDQVDDSKWKAIHAESEIYKLEKQITDLIRCPPAACPAPAAVDAEIAALQRWRAGRKARIDAERRSLVEEVQQADKTINDPKASKAWKACSESIRGRRLSKIAELEAFDGAVEDRIGKLKKSKEPCPSRTETPPTGGPLNMAPPLTPPDGLYAGGTAGWTHLGTVDAVTHFEDGSATDKDHHDEGFAVGARLGVKQGPWRFEGEFNYRRNGLSSITFDTDPKASGSTQAFAFLGNVICDFEVPGLPWATPHVGAGVGVAHLTAKQKITGFTVLNSSDTEFAYQGIAGLRVPIAPNWAVDLDYRYLATTDPTYRSPAGNQVTSSYRTHNLLASLTYSFAPPPLPAAIPAAMPAPARQLFLVFFDWDRDTITPEGMAVIGRAAEVYRTGGYVQLMVTGYTDRSGSPGYNQRLSERRASNVAGALARLGVPRNQMAVTGRGDNDNRVPTTAGVREPQNRRVEIVF
jgi:outer membrane protein OmpA-like peptidoglycan-associated protein